MVYDFGVYANIWSNILVCRSLGYPSLYMSQMLGCQQIWNSLFNTPTNTWWFQLCWTGITKPPTSCVHGKNNSQLSGAWNTSKHCTMQSCSFFFMVCLQIIIMVGSLLGCWIVVTFFPNHKMGLKVSLHLFCTQLIPLAWSPPGCILLKIQLSGQLATPCSVWLPSHRPCAWQHYLMYNITYY